MKNLLRFLSFLLVGVLVLGLAPALLPDPFDEAAAEQFNTASYGSFTGTLRPGWNSRGKSWRKRQK